MLSEKKEIREVRPSAARLIESLRDTGYTFVSAVADVVDNSVSAGASVIKISLDMQFGGEPVLMIADNGSGMDEEGLDAAMMYGSPRRADPKSLGKFGMGLKTASTSMCRKLTVVSSKNGAKSIRQWDLDRVAKLDQWVLTEPELDEYEAQVEFLEGVNGGGNGTVVIWEKIDRLVRSNTEGTQRKQLDKHIIELREHLSGVFYNFLQPGNGYPDLNIEINGESLESWDPFCRWLNSETEHRLDINELKPFRITAEEDGVSRVLGTFHVNVYILPNKQDFTEAESRKARYGLDNQGFHVFREGRMIYSGGWPNRMFVKEPHLNLIRVELVFDHELDDFFQIDIKKSRIDLPKDLRQMLKRVITPARREAQARYRKGSNKPVNGNTGLQSQHGKSSNAIGKHHDSATSKTQIESVDSQKGEIKIKNDFGSSTVKIKFDDKQDTLVQTTTSLQDGVLWMPGLAEGNKHAVILNESHEFYKKFYQAHQENAALIQAMDSVMWSLAEAELSVWSDSVKRNLEDMRFNVSRILRTLAEELPDVDLSENDSDNEE